MAGVLLSGTSMFERGKLRPTERRVDRLAEVYDVDAEWLRSGSDADRPSGATPEESLGSPTADAIAAASAPQVDFVTAAADAVVCPTCGVRGILRRDLIEHLRGTTCERRHSLSEAIRLTREADDDLEHPQRLIQHLKALVAATEARTERLKPENTDLRSYNRQIVASLKELLRREIEQHGDA